MKTRYSAWGRDGSFKYKWMRDLWVWRNYKRQHIQEIRNNNALLNDISTRLLSLETVIIRKKSGNAIKTVSGEDKY